MMPNTNCKDRGGTIRLDDYGLRQQTLEVRAGETVSVPVSMEKCYGMQQLGFSIGIDTDAFAVEEIDTAGSVLTGYEVTVAETTSGVDVVLKTAGNVFDKPCGKLLDLKLRAKRMPKPGNIPLPFCLCWTVQVSPQTAFWINRGIP